jgi:hypothetical protein
MFGFFVDFLTRIGNYSPPNGYNPPLRNEWEISINGIPQAVTVKAQNWADAHGAARKLYPDVNLLLIGVRYLPSR